MFPICISSGEPVKLVEEHKMKKSHILGGISAMLLASATLYAAPGVGKTKIDTDGNGSVSKAESLAASDAMFAKLDVNGDGKLDTADREAKLKEHFAKIDTDKNGSISQAEFIAMHKERLEKRAEWRGKAGFGPDAPPPMADGSAPDGPPPPGMRHGGRHGKMGGGFDGMKMADANGDKTITKAEFRTAAEARFAKADTNKDGTISADERKARHGKGKRGQRPPAPPAAPAPADS